MNAICGFRSLYHKIMQHNATPKQAKRLASKIKLQLYSDAHIAVPAAWDVTVTFIAQQTHHPIFSCLIAQSNTCFNIIYGNDPQPYCIVSHIFHCTPQHTHSLIKYYLFILDECVLMNCTSASYSLSASVCCLSRCGKFVINAAKIYTVKRE